MSKKTKITFEPLYQKCTYHHPDEKGICKNCHGTGQYKDGYYLIIEKNGHKTAWFVDTIK